MVGSSRGDVAVERDGGDPVTGVVAALPAELGPLADGLPLAMDPQMHIGVDSDGETVNDHAPPETPFWQLKKIEKRF